MNLLNWLPYWDAVLPAVLDLVKVLHRTEPDPAKASAKLRRLGDEWASQPAEDAAFKARIDAVEAQPAEPEPEQEADAMPAEATDK